MNIKILRLFIGLTLAVCTMACSATFAAIRYVKAGATGTGNSWTSPSGDLQAMINASASNDEVWVASGEYLPGTMTTDSFTLKNAVKVIGGFFGTPSSEGNVNARDPNPLTNNTILSGDLGGGTHSATVVRAPSGIVDTIGTRLESFTITGGVGAFGAGVSISSNSSPTIANCRIVGNGLLPGPEADRFGGGIYFNGNSAALIVDCVFENNRARRGGAVWLQGASTNAPTFQRCRFEGNVAYYRGGAIENLNASSVTVLTIRECRFIGNVAYAAPGQSDGSDPYKGGGAISNDGGIATVTNCVFSGNRSAQNGGAISNIFSGTLTLRNCTLSGNTAAWRAGGVWMQNGTLTVRNTILWSNHDKDGTENEETQFTVNSGTADVKHSCIQDDAPGGSVPFGGGSMSC